MNPSQVSQARTITSEHEYVQMNMDKCVESFSFDMKRSGIWYLNRRHSSLLKQIRSFRMPALSLIILYNKIKPRILTIQRTFLLWSRLKFVEKIRFRSRYLCVINRASYSSRLATKIISSKWRARFPLWNDILRLVQLRQ